MKVDHPGQREGDVFIRIGASVIDDIARIVIETEHVRPVDPVEDLHADFRRWQHVAVGFHADGQSELFGVVAELLHIGEVGFPFLIGFGVTGEGVHDRHAQTIGDVHGPDEALLSFLGLELGVSAETDRIQTQVGQFAYSTP